MRLQKSIKDSATAAFKNNVLLANMSAEDREEAAKFYEQVAIKSDGTHAELARIYNLERARFLRGQVNRIAATARLFAEEIGFLD